MADEIPTIARDEVVGWSRRRAVYPWINFVTGVHEADVLPAYYDAIEVMPDVGWRIVGRHEIIFDGQRSEVVGHTIPSNSEHDHTPWRFRLVPAHPGEPA